MFLLPGESWRRLLKGLRILFHDLDAVKSSILPQTNRRDPVASRERPFLDRNCLARVLLDPVECDQLSVWSRKLLWLNAFNLHQAIALGCSIFGPLLSVM